MTRRTQLLVVAVLGALVLLVSLVGIMAKYNQLKPSHGFVVFFMQTDPVDTPLHLQILGFTGEGVITTNYWVDEGSFPTVQTVAVTSETVNVTVIALAPATSVACTITWLPANGERQTYMQHDAYNGEPMVPQCDWVRAT